MRFIKNLFDRGRKTRPLLQSSLTTAVGENVEPVKNESEVIDDIESAFSWNLYSEPSDADWGSLLSEFGPSEVRPGEKNVLAEIFDRLRTHYNCQTILVEGQYYEEDFVDVVANYLSKTFRSVSSHYCTRIHFFSKPTESPDQELIDYLASCADADYNGFIVVRPLDSHVVGKTLLRAPDLFLNNLQTRLSGDTFSVNVCGKHFSLLAAPFSEGDGVVNLCAHSCIWMLNKCLEKSHGMAKRFPFEINQLATQYYSGGVSTPSPGLNPWQIAETLKRMGYYPIMYHKKSFKKIDRKWVIPNMVYPYLNSRLPVVLVSSPKNQARHSILLVGEQVPVVSKKPKAKTTFIGDEPAYFVAHNNAVSPYEQFSVEDAQNSDRLIVALPENIRLHADAVQDYFQEILTTPGNLLDRVQALAQRNPEGVLNRAIQILSGKEPVLADVRLVKSNEFKLSLRSRAAPMNGDLVSEFCYSNMPKYVWVIELSDFETYTKDLVVGEIVLDATCDRSRIPFSWIHLPNVLITEQSLDQPFEDDSPYSPFAGSV